jgi:hypothetical protein
LIAVAVVVVDVDVVDVVVVVEIFDRLCCIRRIAFVLSFVFFF